jgi:hypothetical protein
MYPVSFNIDNTEEYKDSVGMVEYIAVVDTADFHIDEVYVP